MSNVLALDPGTFETGYARLVDGKVVESGVSPNAELLTQLRGIGLAGRFDPSSLPTLAIEMIASYGMAVGAEVFETCVWIGRFVEAWVDTTAKLPRMVYRREVKEHLCGTDKAKDPNVRQRLIDLIGPKGTKRDPGPTYGVRSHAWAALGVAATVARLTDRKAA
jgi:hypothetical protein